MLKFDEPVNVKDLLDGEGFTFTTNFDEAQQEEEEDESYYNPSYSLASEHLDELSLQDEDTYEFAQPSFEEIAKKMEPLDERGYVKKRVLRPGRGEAIPAGSKVKFDYKIYHEFDPKAFDSTYQRRKPHLCKLDNGELMWGLDLAVSSMKATEKSQFLVTHQAGYGELGCLPTILPNETLLIEVYLHNYLENIGVAEPEIATDFESNYIYAQKLCLKGNYLVTNEKKYKAAILNYNNALNRMSEVMCENDDHAEKFANLMMRLYSNAAVCYVKLERYGKVCINCRQAYQTARCHDIAVPAKIYFNHAKALYHLNEFEAADEKLKKAAKRTAFTDPDKSVMALYKKIQEALAKDRTLEKKRAKAMFQNNGDAGKKEGSVKKDGKVDNDGREDVEDVNVEFKNIVAELCADVLNGNGQVQLPAGLTHHELAFVGKYVASKKLRLVQDQNDGVTTYFINMRR